MGGCEGWGGDCREGLIFVGNKQCRIKEAYEKGENMECSYSAINDNDRCRPVDLCRHWLEIESPKVELAVYK